MPPPPTFNSALAVWGISRVGSSALQAPYLLAQSRDSIKRRYRELARSWHPDVVRGGGAAPAGGGISDGGGSGSSEEEGKPDLDWLRAARDKLLENLMVEQARDRQRLAEAQRSEQQNQLAAAGNFLAQLADRRQECGKQWDVPAASLQLRFILQEWQAGQHACRYLGVALSGGGRSTTALVTKNGFLLDEPIEQADHMRGLAFAHELLTLQQACNERGWPLQQVAGGSLCVRVDSHHSACFGAQQLVDGTATATVLQVERGRAGRASLGLQHSC